MTKSTNATTVAAGSRRLALVTKTRRPLDREAAVARVRDARRLVEPRGQRFAHLKRMYD
jgi:hypothetical protein